MDAVTARVEGNGATPRHQLREADMAYIGLLTDWLAVELHVAIVVVEQLRVLIGQPPGNDRRHLKGIRQTVDHAVASTDGLITRKGKDLSHCEREGKEKGLDGAGWGWMGLDGVTALDVVEVV